MIATYLSFIFKFTLSEGFSNNLSDALLFLEFMNIVSILHYVLIEFIFLLYTFSVISSARFKKYLIFLFSRFSDVLPTFTRARAIDNLWSICSGANNLHNLNIRFRPCFEQGVPWHSGNYRAWIHSETRMWHDKNIQWMFQLFLLRRMIVGFALSIWIKMTP